MFRKQRRLNWLLVLSASLLLSACEVGLLPDDKDEPLPDSIIGMIKSNNGSSITVNDYTVALTGVTVSYGSDAVSVATLVPGMNVRMQTQANKVTHINLDPTFAGEVSALSAGSINIGAVKVLYHTAGTGISSGDFVLVSTTPSTSLTPVASAVLKFDVRPVFDEIEGRISALDITQQQFSLHNIRVDYSAANAQTLKNGQWVEVLGRYRGQHFSASEVVIQDSAGQGDTEIAGMVSWVNQSQTIFELNGRQLFNVTADTRFDDGTQQQLSAGRFVEVTVRRVNGQPLLLEVDFDDDTPPTDAKPQQFTLSGVATYQNNQLSINGYQFVTDRYTQLEDRLSYDMLDGTNIELEGVLRDGEYLVREIDRAGNEPEMDVEGLVEANKIWGYEAADTSLQPYNGLWVELDCYFDGVRLSQCRRD
ncbi:DUF5666 domain-containing protein [Rheinheimera sp. NSM]|uniref:DUF5666 domain-containing protein n=1 Tax=Rheinheimera sp. NSM TaxID=3457884 RepID=UPI004036EAED